MIQLLDPRILAKLASLELLARTVVEGFVSGLHRSPALGLSLDFAEHRAYMPGDDIRRIDWRVFGRTDRFYLKEFEADTNTNVWFLLDVSRSMAFTSGGVSKLDYGRFLTASLAWLARRQRDRVGLVTFGPKPIEIVPCAASHLPHILHALTRAAPAGGADLDAALAGIAEQLRRRSIVVVISDLYAEPARVRRLLERLRGRGNDLVVFHLLDPAELDFPYADVASFEDLETGERMPVVPAQLADRYRTALRAHVAALGQGMREGRVDYTLLNTKEPLDRALFAYLAARERRQGTRR